MQSNASRIRFWSVALTAILSIAYLFELWIKYYGVSVTAVATGFPTELGLLSAVSSLITIAIFVRPAKKSFKP
jgi:hypothetical protein